MKKWYFITAMCENNRFLQFITKERNPLDAYNSFKIFAKQEGIKEPNIKIFNRIK